MSRPPCAGTVVARRPNAELFVRTTLPHFVETESDEYGDDFSRPEDRYRRHATSGDDNGLRADILTHHHGLAIFEEHGDDRL